MKNTNSNRRRSRAAAPEQAISAPSSFWRQSQGTPWRVPPFLSKVWSWLRTLPQTRSNSRRLQLEETVSLGQKRFVAVVRVDGQRMLIGGGVQEVTLLANLGPAEEFASVLVRQRARSTPRKSPLQQRQPQQPAQRQPRQGRHHKKQDQQQQQGQPGGTAEILPITSTTPLKLLDNSSQAIGADQKPAGQAQAKLRRPNASKVKRASSIAATAICLALWLRPTPSLADTYHFRPEAPIRQSLSTEQLSPAPAAEPPSDPNEIRISGLGGNSPEWTIFVLLTVLTLIPSVLICMTPFARLLIVFHFLRQALGLQTTPSNQTLIGLSAIMTFFIMQPVGAAIYRDALVPLQAGKITPMDALARAGAPMRQFMSHYVRDKDVALFVDLAKEPRPANVNDVSFRVLLPAYIVSELKAGFQIGAVLFLPFLVIDMVVASITTSVGMMQLPPVVISTPLKLMLFLMVDGWHLLIGALIRSFN